MTTRKKNLKNKHLYNNESNLIWIVLIEIKITYGIKLFPLKYEYEDAYSIAKNRALYNLNPSPWKWSYNPFFPDLH